MDITDHLARPAGDLQLAGTRTGAQLVEAMEKQRRGISLAGFKT